MSVINKMLADLEQRRSPAALGPANAAVAGAADAPPVVVPVRSRAGARRLQLAVLVGAALASAAALGNWPEWFGTRQRLPQPVTIAMAQPSPPPARVDAAEGVKPAPLAVLRQPEGVGAKEEGPTERTVDGMRLNGFSYSLVIPRAPASLAVPRHRKHATASRVMPVAAASSASAPSAEAEPAASEATLVDKQMVALTAPQRVAQAYRQATELATAGTSSQAIDKALEALALDPTHVGARQLAAVLLFETHRRDEARALLADGLAHGLHDAQLTYLAARMTADAGDREAALQILAGAPALGAQGHALRAGLLAQAGRYRESLPAYEAAVRLNPEEASWWLGLGVALDALGESAPARLAFQRARALGSLQGDLLAYVEQKLSAR